MKKRLHKFHRIPSNIKSYNQSHLQKMSDNLGNKHKMSVFITCQSYFHWFNGEGSSVISYSITIISMANDIFKYKSDIPTKNLYREYQKLMKG